MSFLQSKHARAFFINFSISFAVALIVIILTQDIVFEFLPLKRLELSLIDLRFRQRRQNMKIRDSSDVVIVEISQESFKSLPERWPWPKSYFARVVKNLQQAGARAIGIDLVFSSADQINQQSDVEFQRVLEKTGRVVLAGRIESQEQYYTLKGQHENYGNSFIHDSSRFGIVNVFTDDDGVLRRYMPLIFDTVHQRRIPTFSLAVLNAYYDEPFSFTAGIESKTFYYRGRHIPQYDPASFLINYYGPSGTFPRIKFVDVLDDRDFKTLEEDNLGEDVNTFDDPTFGYLYDQTLRNKIVLIGSTMPEDKDLFPVTIGQGRREGDNQMYGVEIHANVIQSILDRNFIIRQSFWMTVLVVFGLSLFTFVFIAALLAIRTKYSMFIRILAVMVPPSELFIIYWASLKVFTEYNFLTEMTSPLLVVGMGFMGSTVYHYMTEHKQRLMITNMFGQYVNRDVVNELIKHPEKLRLSGERRELTVMFTDIENFTALAEKTRAEELVAILNEYLDIMTSIIFHNRGTLDKYEGDAIMAFWGAPIPQSEHALLACNTALQMQDAIVDIRRRWKEAGRANLNVRIGINTGEMIVGNIGGRVKYEYTAIGDSVNLGARLESANKQYRTNIMISEHTYKKVESHVFARELDMLVVAGKTEPIRVYELLGLVNGQLSTELLKFNEYYTKGLKLYREQEWRQAIEQFEKALQFRPDDYPSQIYIERSHIYLTSPPPDNWNGVFILRSK
ncbi:MAG: CHASE2 domain-containing protein [Ignavibacteriae bacterium]|nr:CHASE2 domain-containing protein [Ignavibacteriota bacterium]